MNLNFYKYISLIIENSEIWNLRSIEMNFEECCLITDGRCPYEIDNKCTLYGSKRPYGKPLCEIEELKYKNEILNF